MLVVTFWSIHDAASLTNSLEKNKKSDSSLSLNGFFQQQRFCEVNIRAESGVKQRYM
jgi:hypothetical protein